MQLCLFWINKHIGMGLDTKKYASSDPLPTKRLMKMRMIRKVSSVRENGKDNVV